MLHNHNYYVYSLVRLETKSSALETKWSALETKSEALEAKYDALFQNKVL